MKPFIRLSIATLAVLGLFLGSQMSKPSFGPSTAQAFPGIDGDIQIPPPPPDDPCWETLPNGIKIATCLEAPTEPPPPTPSPSPSPTPEAEDEDDMDAGDGGINPDQGVDLDGPFDMDTEGGGCALIPGANASSSSFMLLGIAFAALGTLRMTRIRK